MVNKGAYNWTTMHWKCIGSYRNWKSLIKFKVFCVVRWTLVAFKIFLHDLFGNVAGTPCTIADTPQMFAPVALTQYGELFLKQTGRSAFHPFDKIAYWNWRRIFYMNVDMILNWPHHSVSGHPRHHKPGSATHDNAFEYLQSKLCSDT